MDTITPLSFVLSTLTILQYVLQAISDSSPLDNFFQCLSNHSPPSSPASNAIYTPKNSSFLSILHMHTHNHRFSNPNASKPLAIVTPIHVPHVQGTVICAKNNGLQIRIRSGGHDCEGLSYVSDVPFIILDMFHFGAVDVDIASGTTWVQAGATLGQLYYQIAKKSKIHAFPAGVCPTLGTGGHFSYGLSVDNIIDAKLVDVNGEILDRKSMGEDLFWAIRGGGGASFGVILSWKIQLVHVTPKVTVFKVRRTLEKGATDVVYKWQLIATKLQEDLFIRTMFEVVNSTQNKKTIQVTFIGLFLGKINDLFPLLNETFPELALLRSDCSEIPWINSTLYWANYPIGTPIESLLDVPKEPISYSFKTMSDYVKNPIPKTSLESIWEFMIKIECVRMEWNPYGGKMDNISALETPFPHRGGNLFLIEYLTSWGEDGVEARNHYLEISRLFYEFMAPYVSNSPREAFLNYRDLDIGVNHQSSATIMDIAPSFGRKYFRANFERLVSVKFKVDPENFFRFEQSIPPMSR
ncbi:berberine bridge enzyme-like 17 [Lotus japonicus]|uniref:berberine bridge enzyme-like 17 n=1 Tax=Lotus japonicus TaxID=34305 RepID=UPI0025873AE1|nr:berberine bridge enzyme-like 17 [Lotus japonicus]